MKVAIIGPGNMGRGIARLLVGKGHNVALAHKDLQVATRLAAEIGTSAKGADVASAVSDADTVILAVPFDSVEAALKEAGDLTGKVLVDITNPVTPDYMALTIGHTTSVAEEVAKLAPGAHKEKHHET